MEDDEDLKEGMGDSDYGVSDLSWSQNEALPDGWSTKDVDDEDNLDPALGVQILMEIEDLLGMDWDPYGSCVPLYYVKRTQKITLKTKYEELFDEDIGLFFAFLPIALWEKIVYDTNKQGAKKLGEKMNKCIAGKNGRLCHWMNCCISLGYKILCTRYAQF
jgi:hypothetical protein